jgi:hypothetical protein
VARPRGYVLSRPAFTDLVLAMHTSLPKVAAEAGIPPKTLASVVAGKRGASMATVLKLSMAMRCQPASLFPERLGTPAETVQQAS